MALQQCPDCGKEVSSEAPSCPHCGRPIAVTPPTEKTNSAPQPKKGSSCSPGCLLALVIAIVLFIISLGSDDLSKPTGVTAPQQTRTTGKHTSGQAQFQRFKAAFNELNRSVKAQTGSTFFTSCRYAGDGIVNITATDIWLSAPREDRESNAQTIYEMWRAAEGTGLPVFVNFYDQRGNKIMTR